MKDNRFGDDFWYEVDIEWGPLFKVDRQTRLQMMQTHAQAVTTLIGNYVITPDEARSILTEEWAAVDVDDLDEDQMDTLDRINLAQVGQGRWAELNDPSSDLPEQNAQASGSEGGRPEGAQQSSEQSGVTPDGAEKSTGELNGSEGIRKASSDASDSSVSEADE
jgi:hypothetical protein